MIEEGDRIAVGVSGGKDSYALLHMLETLRRRAPVKYELMAINIDSGYPGFRADIIEQHLKEHGFTYHMEKTGHYDIIKEKRRPSLLLLHLRQAKRGTLYALAQKFECNKLALGHHLDDFVETLLLNPVFRRFTESHVRQDARRNGVTTVIRPFKYARRKKR
jgi:tRNA 2-thiocytidine biosynthesis protein TtcA